MDLRLKIPISRLMGTVLVLAFADSQAKAEVRVVRLVTVRVLEDSGLLGELLPDFEKQTGYCVKVRATTMDLYNLARAGQADLVISHYGFSELEHFVLEGFGLWPRTICANQVTLLGPLDDPAHVRGFTEAVQGFHRIAQTQSTFLVNNNPVTKTDG